jgi:hypothetical protein
MVYRGVVALPSLEWLLSACLLRKAIEKPRKALKRFRFLIGCRVSQQEVRYRVLCDDKKSPAHLAGSSVLIGWQL